MGYAKQQMFLAESELISVPAPDDPPPDAETRRPAAEDDGPDHKAQQQPVQNSTPPIREQGREIQCQHCGKPFAPRARSGGRPQKFCGEAHRRAADAERKARKPQRAQRPSDETAPRDQPPLRKQNALVTFQDEAFPVDDAWEPISQDRYDWPSHNVVIEEQPAIAIYFNAHGGMVIRQQGSPLVGQADSCVVVNSDHIKRFTTALMLTVMRAGTDGEAE